MQTVFEQYFLEGPLQVKLMTDQGSDTNILLRNALMDILIRVKMLLYPSANFETLILYNKIK